MKTRGGGGGGGGHDFRVHQGGGAHLFAAVQMSNGGKQQFHDLGGQPGQLFRVPQRLQTWQQLLHGRKMCM